MAYYLQRRSLWLAESNLCHPPSLSPFGLSLCSLRHLFSPFIYMYFLFNSSPYKIHSGIILIEVVTTIAVTTPTKGTIEGILLVITIKTTIEAITLVAIIKLPFHVTSSSSTQCLELLHCDLWGFASSISLSGF